MKHILILTMALLTFALKAESSNTLVLILKPLSQKKDPVKKQLISATYLARVFNYDLDRVVTINFKNSFAGNYHSVTEGARELKVGEVVRVYSSYSGPIEKLEKGEMNAQEKMIESFYEGNEVDHSKFEKIITYDKPKLLMNCHSSYFSMIVSVGENYFTNVYLGFKDHGNTVYYKDPLYTVKYLKNENTLVLDRSFSKIFVPLKSKKVEGIYFESGLYLKSLPEALSNDETNPAERFTIDNDQVNDGLSCSSFKHSELLKLVDGY